MNQTRLLFRNLFFHWRGNLAILLGAAVGAAVLAGALLVGDSLRGSLRARAERQLGWVGHVLVGGRFIRQEVPAQGALDDESAAATTRFLLALPSELEGGFRANDRIPTADLLSTFTGAWTLAQLGALDRLDAHSMRSYAEALESKSGGYRGGLWDNATDVEYTFYGLGVVGLFTD